VIGVDVEFTTIQKFENNVTDIDSDKLPEEIDGIRFSDQEESPTSAFNMGIASV